MGTRKKASSNVPLSKLIMMAKFLGKSPLAAIYFRLKFRKVSRTQKWNM
jgi:hypothetical protein